MPTTIKIDSDWSSASYFLALGAMSEEGVVVQNMNPASLQGDRVILDILRNMGAKVTVTGAQVAVSYDHLKGIHADLSDCIDLLPTVAVLAAVAKGTTDLIGIQRARIKESNRVAAIRECLTKLGVVVVEHENRLVINGNDYFYKPTEEELEEIDDEKPKEQKPVTEGPVVLNSRGDHRIAMAFGVLGAVLGDIIIDSAECVTKSYPTFWDDFKKVGGEVKLDG
jgi:3-phosphoshikimate 1-carboxyvinyltransferase